MLAASAWLLLLTLAATVLPLSLGLRALYRRLPVKPERR